MYVGLDVFVCGGWEVYVVLGYQNHLVLNVFPLRATFKAILDYKMNYKSLH